MLCARSRSIGNPEVGINLTLFYCNLQRIFPLADGTTIQFKSPSAAIGIFGEHSLRQRLITENVAKIPF